MDLNRVTLIGNIVRDPEMRTTPNGAPVASFSIATNMVWTDQAGQKQQKAEFHNIVAWRRLAEICSQYLRRGAKVFLEGRLETRDWTDQAGQKRYRTEVIADNLIMLDRPGQAGPFQPGMSAPAAYGAASQPQAYQPSQQNSQSNRANNIMSETPVIGVDEPVGRPVYNGPKEVEDDIKVEDIPF